MRSETTTQQLLARFKLPAQDLPELSFCKGNRSAAVKNWAESLPATQVNQTSVQLYKALPEVARLKTSADNRLEMLEYLRPCVLQCVEGLARHFLNQPLILPEAPLKSAVIAQALQKHLSAGYSLALAQLIANGRKSKGNEEAMALACHRAITGLGMMLLRSYQLYSRVPPNLWLHLHSLYRLAEEYDLLDRPVDDPLLRRSGASTLAQAYHRILLLACSRPSQMRQTDVSATYDVLETWSHLVRLQKTDRPRPDNLFVVNLSADVAPLYKSRFSGKSGDDLRELNLLQLLADFRKQREKRSNGVAISLPHTVSTALAEHLERAWGANQERSFERRSSMDKLDVCVGLGNLHHQTIGGISLEEFLGESAFEHIELSAVDEGNAASEDPQAKREPDIHSVDVANSSPGGYCLVWRNRIPSQVKAGEVLGLREPGRHRWGLGIIRWVQQEGNASRLGVQLLAPRTIAYGAAVELPDGSFTDFRRVLMLRELKAANQPATLITAFAPFQENQRLRLNSHGETQLVQLNRRIFATGSVNQFTFRTLEVDSPGESAENGGFASVWEE